MKREDIASSIRCVHRRYLVTRVRAPNWVMAFAAFYESESKGKLRLKDNILGVGGGGQRAGCGGARAGPGRGQSADSRKPSGRVSARRVY